MRLKVLMILLVCGGLVFGQTNDRRRFSSDVFNKGRRIQSQVDQTLWHFGSWHMSPILGVRDLGFDTNVFSTEQEEQDDFTLSPELGIQAYYRFNNRLFWANRATANYLYYIDLSDLRGWEWGGESRIHALFKNAYFDIGGNFRRDRTRVSSEIDDRFFSERTTLDANLVFQPTPRGSLTITPRVYSLSYDQDNDLSGFSLIDLERDETEVLIQYMHRVRPEFWPFVEVSQTSYDFKSPSNLRDDSEQNAFYIGARNEYGKRMHYNVKLGTEQLNFDLAPNVDDDIIGAQGFLSYKVTRLWDIEATVQQLPVFSFTQDYAYFTSSRVSFGFGYTFRNKVRLGPEFDLGSNDYEKPFNPAAISVLRQDDISQAALRVTIPVARSYEWNLRVGYLERDSNLPGFSDEGVQIISDISYKIGQ